MDNIELEKLEEIQRIITGIVMNALAKRQRELQETNRKLELEIKTKEANLRSLNMISKSNMFAPPDQQPNYEPADSNLEEE